MINYKISIIVPVYNVEKYLAECIDSIIKQTYKNIEIILIDDGSTDYSGKICDKYKVLDNRIKVFHKPNGGLSDARNYGLKKSTGEYVTFVDSDDIIQNNMIEKMKQCLFDNESISVCKFEKFKEKYKYSIGKKKIVKYPTDFFDNVLYLNISLYACGVLIPKHFFDNVKFIKGRYFEDLATMYKIYSKASTIIILDDQLYKYRFNNNSIVHTVNMKKINDYLFSANEMIDFLKKNYSYNEAQYNTYFSYLYRECYILSKDNNYLVKAKKSAMNADFSRCNLKNKVKLYLLKSSNLTKILIKIK